MIKLNSAKIFIQNGCNNKPAVAKSSQPVLQYIFLLEQSFFRKNKSGQPEGNGKQQHARLVIPDTDITGYGKKAEPEDKKACGKESVAQPGKVRHAQQQGGIFHTHGNAADYKGHKNNFRARCNYHKIQQQKCDKNGGNQSGGIETLFHSVICPSTSPILPFMARAALR